MAIERIGSEALRYACKIAFVIPIRQEEHTEKASTVAELQSYLASNPTVIQYAMLEPIETPLSETELAAYRALHTNKPNTTILNDGGAHMAVAYAADTKMYIDNKIAALVGNN